VICGWPAVLASTLLTIAGITRRSAMIARAGAMIASPFMIFLFFTPRFRLIALPVLFAHYATAYALRRDRRVVAAAFFAPFIVLASYVFLLAATAR
jgi:hypothetical protein